jgi:sugar phosphate isomerase/epimerase
MIRLSTTLRLGAERAALERLASQCAYLGIRTICGATQPEWADEVVAGIRAFLDERGLRVGELSRFHHGFAAPDREANRAGLEAYRRHLDHAAILGAVCVGFSFSGIYGQPDVRSEAAWGRAVAATGALAAAAEAAGVDVAAHPHLLGPLCSVERLARLLREVGSPRVKVLIDPVNLVTADTYHDTTALLDTIFDALGERIVAAHAKDVAMTGLRRNEHGMLSVCHLDEVLPGRGNLDYATFLRRLHALGRDVVAHVEHLGSQDEQLVALHHLRHVAQEQGIPLA